MISSEISAQIIEFIHKFYAHFDRFEWSDVQNCFAGEVYYDMESVTGEPAATKTSKEIVGEWQSGLSGHKFLHHTISNHRVFEEKKTGLILLECYGCTYHGFSEGIETRIQLALGEYKFKISRPVDDFLICSMVFKSRFHGPVPTPTAPDMPQPK